MKELYSTGAKLQQNDAAFLCYSVNKLLSGVNGQLLEVNGLGDKI